MCIGSFEDISDADNCDVIAPDEPWDQLLNVFFRIISDLHQYNRSGTISKKSQKGQDKKKIDLVEINHDESVRLEQETEEVELKASKDKDPYKEAKTVLTKENQEENFKRLEDEDEINYRNYQLKTFKKLTDMSYYDPRKFLRENDESNGQLHSLIWRYIYQRKNKRKWVLDNELKSRLVDSPKNNDEPKEIKEKSQQKFNLNAQQIAVKEEIPKQNQAPMQERVSERVTERVQERNVDRMPERIPERYQERMPDRMPDRIPDRIPERMPERIQDRIQDRILERQPERVQGPPISQIMNVQKNMPQNISPEIVIGAMKNSNQPMQNQMIMNLLNQSSMKFSNPPINPMNRTTQSPSVMQMMPQQPSLPQQNYQLPCLTNIVQNLDKSKVHPTPNSFPSYIPMNQSMLIPDRRSIPESYMIKGNNYNQVAYSNFPMTGGIPPQVQLPRLNHISNTLNQNPYSQQPHQQIPFLNAAHLNKMIINQPRMQQNPHLGMYQNNNIPMMRAQPPHQDYSMQNPMLHQLGKPPMKPNQPQYPYSK